MRLFTTGEVRRLFTPPVPESRIRNRIRAGSIHPLHRAGAQFLWTPDEIAVLARLLGTPLRGDAGNAPDAAVVPLTRADAGRTGGGA